MWGQPPSAARELQARSSVKNSPKAARARPPRDSRRRYKNSTLERDIFVSNRTRCCGLRLRNALVEVVAACRRSARTAGKVSATTSAFAAPAEQDQVAGYDFGHIFLLASLLVVPRAGLQASLDVDLPAFFQILSGDFSQTLPQHDVMPFGAVLPFAGLVLEPLVGGEGDLRYGRALRRVFDFGILAQIADQLNPVQTLYSHIEAPLPCRGSL